MSIVFLICNLARCGMLPAGQNVSLPMYRVLPSLFELQFQSFHSFHASHGQLHVRLTFTNQAREKPRMFKRLSPSHMWHTVKLSPQTRKREKEKGTDKPVDLLPIPSFLTTKQSVRKRTRFRRVEASKASEKQGSGLAFVCVAVGQCARLG